MRKKNWLIGGIIVVVIAVAAYFSFGGHGSQKANKTVTIGVMAGDKNEDEIWKSVIKTAKDKYGITLKTKKFTDYLQPNKALSAEIGRAHV